MKVPEVASIEARLSFLYDRTGSGRRAEPRALVARSRPVEPVRRQHSVAGRGGADERRRTGALVTEANRSGRVAVPALVFFPGEPAAPARPRRRPTTSPTAAGRRAQVLVAVVVGSGPATRELEALASRGWLNVAITVLRVPSGAPVRRSSRSTRQ